MAIKNPLEGALNRMERFDKAHPEVLELAFGTMLTSVTVGAEAMALRLADNQHTIPNSLGRAACRTLAIGSGLLTVKHAQYFAKEYLN